MTPFEHTAGSIAELVGGEVTGDPNRPIKGVADVRCATATDVGFIRDAKFAPSAKETGAGALLVTELLETAAVQIVVEDAHVAFAKVALHFHPVPTATEHVVHATAVVDATAELEEPVGIGAHAVVEAGARVGAGSLVQAGSVVMAGARVGRDCTLFPRVVLYPGTTLGDRVIVHAGAVLGSDGFGYVIEKSGIRNKFPQLGTLVIGDDVEIGANTTIDRGALNPDTIGSGTKIDNLCHIGHNCKIGSNSTISGLSAFAAGTVIGDRVIVAGHVVSGGDLSVCDDVLIGGNSVVTKDVKEPGEYGGYPLLPRRKAARTVVLHGRLAELAAEMKDLRKKLDGK